MQTPGEGPTLEETFLGKGSVFVKATLDQRSTRKPHTDDRPWFFFLRTGAPASLSLPLACPTRGSGVPGAHVVARLTRRVGHLGVLRQLERHHAATRGNVCGSASSMGDGVLGDGRGVGLGGSHVSRAVLSDTDSPRRQRASPGMASGLQRKEGRGFVRGREPSAGFYQSCRVPKVALSRHEVHEALGERVVQAVRADEARCVVGRALPGRGGWEGVRGWVPKLWRVRVCACARVVARAKITR